MTIGALTAREVDRATLQRWLPCLDAWLLPDAFYSVQHTWPQLYRSDGQGRFFVVTDGDRLLSHCASRLVTVVGGRGPFAACLIGSVATDPAHRGQGLAGQVLALALQANDPHVRHTLLWAERPELYARAGFRAGPDETCLVLARRPHPVTTGVRPMVVADHAALHALHQQKRWRVERSAHAMSNVLSTPGMSTFVLERAGAIVAYACCGKAADLQGHWHELGGADEDLAQLLPAALALAGQTEAVLLLPPWRGRLREHLARHIVQEATLPGPLHRSLGEPLPGCWIDGLDSV